MSNPNAGPSTQISTNPSTNLYRALRELLPDAPLLVGTITALNADDTATITYPDGNTQRVRGPALAINTPVFVRNGLIEGTAPALTAVVIEV